MNALKKVQKVTKSALQEVKVKAGAVLPSEPPPPAPPAKGTATSTRNTGNVSSTPPKSQEQAAMHRENKPSSVSDEIVRSVADITATDHAGVARAASMPTAWRPLQHSESCSDHDDAGASSSFSAGDDELLLTLPDLLDSHARSPHSAHLQQAELPEKLLADLTPQEQHDELRRFIKNDRYQAATIRKLQDQVEQQNQRYLRLEQEWKRNTDTLAAFRQESNVKVDDERLTSAYQGIVFQIQNWIGNYCHNEVISRIGRRNKGYLKALTPMYHEYLDMRKPRRLLLQSLLMNWLASEVLTFDREYGLWWAGDMSSTLRTLQTQIQPAKTSRIPELINHGRLEPAKVREYSLWAARSAQMVSEKAKRTEVETNIRGILSGLKKCIDPFVGTNVKFDAWRTLEEIVRHTVNLDEEMCCSRALFAAHCWTEATVAGMRFDEEIMQTAIGMEAARPGMMVELVLAPALTKTGTADGDSFESTSYISKWVVVCASNRRVS